MPAKFERTDRPGIYLRGSTYYASVTVDGSTRKLAAGPKIGDAVRMKRKLEAERDRGGDVFGGRERVPFVDYATAWIESYSGRGAHRISERTRDEYRRDMSNWAYPWFARTQIGRITRKTIQDWIAHLQNDTHLADATIRRVSAPVRACLADAHDNGDIVANPASGIRIRSARTAGADEQVKVLTRAQLVGLIGGVDPRHQPLVLLLAASGLRINEALACDWRSIDLGSRPSVTVSRAVKKLRGRSSFGPPKSRFGERTVRIDPAAAAALRLHQAQSEWHRPDDLVFCTAGGTVLDDGNLRVRALKPALRSVGAGWAGFHTLRHTYASLRIAQGCTIVELQRAMGHHSPAFTLARYSHLMPDDDGGALDLGGLLGVQEGVQSHPSTHLDTLPERV